jgi:hypothetical protein
LALVGSTIGLLTVPALHTKSAAEAQSATVTIILPQTILGVERARTPLR